MRPEIVIYLIAAYFGILILISRFTSKEESGKTFFTGNRDTPWYIIAFGMIGTSISGVTFISVPGKVGTGHFGYMQVVLGYLLGYIVVSQILLPLYYKHNLTSIYQYLNQRFGKISYKTGAFFFLISRLLGSSLRLCVVAIVLHQWVFLPLGIPFWVSVATTVVLIYVYTFQSGVKTVIWTDTIQTVGLLAGLIISIVIICQTLHWSPVEAITKISESVYVETFYWDALKAGFFFKAFLGGAAVTITMTGLDQDMMQKNLACRSLADAQKNMMWFSITLVGVNLLFVGLGALMYLYGTETGILQVSPDLMLKNATTGAFEKIRSDALFPRLANEYLGPAAATTFILGVIAAAYSSADSAMTALTTSFCIDILDFENSQYSDAQKKNIRYIVHIGFALLTIGVILYFYMFNTALIDKVLSIAGYTYGPLLGLFSFGVLTRYKLKETWVPAVCIIPPIICYFLQNGIPMGGEKPVMIAGAYEWGLELLIVNGLLTFIGLWAIKQNKIETV